MARPKAKVYEHYFKVAAVDSVLDNGDEDDACIGIDDVALYEEDVDGEIVNDLEWGLNWKEKVSVAFLRSKGFDVMFVSCDEPQEDVEDVTN